MSQRQQRGPGSSGSTDVETGKPQDSRQSRYPGESNLAKDPQHAQQQPERGQNEQKQFGGTKGSSQQQGKQQGGNRDQQSQQDRDSKQGFEQGRHAGQANFEGGASGNQPHAPKGTKQQAQQPQAGGAKQHGDKLQGQQGSQGDKQYGEGNYAASRDYNERTKQFVESGRVDEAARKAAPGSDKEAREMSEAEREGRRPMREEDPAINPDKGSKKPGGPDTRQ